MTFIRHLCLCAVTCFIYMLASSTEASAFDADVPSFAECAHGMRCIEVKETKFHILVKGIKSTCPSGYYYVLNRTEQYVEPILVPCEPDLKVTLEGNRLKLELDGETEFVSLE